MASSILLLVGSDNTEITLLFRTGDGSYWRELYQVIVLSLTVPR